MLSWAQAQAEDAYLDLYAELIPAKVRLTQPQASWSDFHRHVDEVVTQRVRATEALFQRIRDAASGHDVIDYYVRAPFAGEETRLWDAGYLILDGANVVTNISTGRFMPSGQ